MTGGLKRFFPFLSWFPVSVPILQADFIAGVTGALVLVPKAMAYAQLSGLPLYFGLYTAFIPAILGALWGSSRQLATGPVAIVSLMTAAAVAPLALPGTPEYIGLALLLTLLVGLFQLGLGLLRLGTVVNFISHPVILGFMNAAAIIIGLSQMDMLLGVPKGRSDFFLKDIWEMLTYLHQTHLPTLAMSVFGLLLMLLLPKVPYLAKTSVLVAVSVTTLVSWLIGFEQNMTIPVQQITSGQAVELINAYGGLEQRIKDMSVEATDLAIRQRKAEKEGDDKAAAELRYRVDITRVDIEALEKERRRKLREVRQLILVDVPEEGEGHRMVLYVPEEEFDTPDAKLTRWHVRSIDKGVVNLIGGGDVVGRIPSGLPAFRLPMLSFDAVLQLLSSALMIALVAFMESISMAKVLASKAKQHIDPNQELIGQGLANVGGAFFQSYPACGSFTGSAINLQAGAKTGFAMVFNGLFVAATLLFLTPLLYHLPKAVLAMNNLLAVAGLITIQSLKHTWKASKADGTVALVTFALTLLAAPHLDKGIMIGAGLAIVLYLHRTMSPRVAILGRFEDGTLRDVNVNPNLTTSPLVTILRYDGSLYFADVSHFEDAVLKAVADRPQARFLLIVCDAVNSMDSSGEEMLQRLVVQMRETGVEMVFSGPKKQVLDVMRATGLFNLIGDENVFATECQALDDIFRRLGEDVQDDPLYAKVRALQC